MILFPAIDLYENACVRLHKGDYRELTVYHNDPVEQARAFEGAGCTHLHLVDLEAAKSGTSVHLHILESIKAKTGLKVDFGGGIRNEKDAITCLEAGADQVNIGTFAIRQQDRFYALMESVGPGKIILSADRHGEKLKTHGWQKDAGISFWEYLDKFVREGGRFVTSTDISRDGTLSGVDRSGYLEIMERYPQLKIIVSGGVSNARDILQFQGTGIYGIIAGKAIYEKRIDLSELNKQLKPKTDAH